MDVVGLFGKKISSKSSNWWWIRSWWDITIWKIKIKILVVNKSVNPQNVSMLNKSEGEGGILGLGKLGGWDKREKLFLLPPSPLLKDLFCSQSLFSLDWISKSLILDGLSKNLLNFFFFYQYQPLINEPIRGFCASKCFTFLNQSSLRFLCLIMFFEIGLSLLLKPSLFNLLLVTYRPNSSCISSPKSLVANRNFFRV